jgi:hypothetical protein
VTRPNFTVSLQGRLRYWSNTYPGGLDYTPGDYRFSSEVISGVSRRKPKGWVAPTNYSLLAREYLRPTGSRSVSWSKSTWRKQEGCVGTTTGGGSNALNWWNQCVSEATANTRLNSSAALVAARLKLKQGKVNLGVAFAERNATARMLGDTATRIAKALRATRRGDIREAARALGILHDVKKPRGSNWTNHWLQLQYGWKPLLSDVYGAAAALSKRPKDYFRVTAKAFRSDTDQWVDLNPPTGSPSGLTNDGWGYLTVADRERGVFARIDAIPDNDLVMSFTSLGLTNPLLIAWEVVPFSFVVDWAIPIGNWLDSLDAHLGYSSAYTSISYRNKTRWETNGISKSFAEYVFGANDFYGYKEVLAVDRIASSGVALPSLPRFKDPRSLGHMANGLSLLAQAFGR